MNSKYHITILTLSTCFFISTASFLHKYPTHFDALESRSKRSTNAGEPLILTPYLEQGKIQLAQNLSRVSITQEHGVTSHSGFFTIDKRHNSNLYFWYFPPISKASNAPVLIWLEGGPGVTGLFGQFVEIGPFKATKTGLELKQYHWAKNYHVIFVDSPVGTGFSFTDSEDAYCRDEPCVARNLHTFLMQFFQMFPDLKKNDFYITGESYGGKFVPALGAEIHRCNAKDNKNKINLKGLAIGNAYSDPITQTYYGKNLFFHGLIDLNQLKVFERIEKEAVAALKRNDIAKASTLINSIMVGNTSYFKKYTDFDSQFNILLTQDEDVISGYVGLMYNERIRFSLHVGNLVLGSNDEKVAGYLDGDILQSVASDVSLLLSHYPMMFYSGQLDIIVSYIATDNFLRNLNFSSSREFKEAQKHHWRVDNELAGYVKSAGNLTQVLVRNCGHLVPHEQPKWSFDMITRFIDKTL